MNPDVVRAIARLRAENVLSGGQAALFDRVARRQLVSVRFEIRTLLYAGVLLLTSGVALLVTEHHREIGPWAIAGGIGLAAAACLVWVIRKAEPFSWGEVQSPKYVHIAPLWATLTLSGAALAVLALAVERALRRAREGDIAGFTADPLFSDERRQHALQVVPVVAAFTPAAPGPVAPEKDFTGGGGTFGGGGAGERF